jgi:hypothetical protein
MGLLHFDYFHLPGVAEDPAKFLIFTGLPFSPGDGEKYSFERDLL